MVLFFTICPFGGLSCMAHSLQDKVLLLHHKSSCASQLAACAQCLQSHKTTCIFQLVVCAKVSTNTSHAALPDWQRMPSVSTNQMYWHSGWLSNSCNITRANCNKIWLTSHRQMPFQLPASWTQVWKISNVNLPSVSTQKQTQPC